MSVCMCVCARACVYVFIYLGYICIYVFSVKVITLSSLKCITSCMVIKLIMHALNG